jgi:VWFA-related protein
MLNGTHLRAVNFGPLGMRSLAKPRLACLLTLLTTAVVTAQQSPPPQPIPKITARTELVTVPVVVLRHRNPLRQLLLRGDLDEHLAGLTKGDFEIEEDGQPKPIASFEEILSPNAQVRGVTPPPGVFTNEVASNGPISMVVILLDLINTPYLHQEEQKRKLLEYLQRDYPGDRPTMLVALHPDGLKILHNFTTDPQVLASIARHLGSNRQHDPTRDNQIEKESGHAIAQQIDIRQESEAIEKEFTGVYAGQDAYARWVQNDRLKATFQELQQLAHALSALRGMKTLVWLTGGFILSYSMDFKSQSLVYEYERTLKLLSASDVTVYPIDTVLETYNPGLSSRSLLLPGPGSVQSVQNFMDISQRTGGDYCLLRKDPDLCFRKAMDYASQYYLLSYYAQPAETVRWRKIHVGVHGENLRVQARSGYYSAGANEDPERRRKSDIAQAFATPLEYLGLPISVRWTGSREEPASRTKGSAASTGEPLLQQRHLQSFVLGIDPATLAVDAADHNHLQLDIVAVALDRNGKLLADLAKQIDLHPSAVELDRLRNGGFAYSDAIKVSPDTSKVRFIVRDDLSERIGTVSAFIEAQP